MRASDPSVKHSQPPNSEQYRNKLLVYLTREYLVESVVSGQGNVEGKQRCSRAHVM